MSELEPGGITHIETNPLPSWWYPVTIGTGLLLAAGVAAWLLAGPAEAQGTKSSLVPVIGTTAEVAAGVAIVCTASCAVTSVYGTAGATPLYLMTFAGTAIPPDGAVSTNGTGSGTTAGTAAARLRDCIPMAAGQAAGLDYGGVSDNFSPGLVLVFSTTGCDIKTAAPIKFFKVRKS